MRYSKILLVALSAILIAPACRRGNDLFISPNSPAKATPQSLLTYVEVSTINSYEGDLNRSASILIQHNVGTDGQATQTQVYSLTESLFDNQWVQLYGTLLSCDSLQRNFGAANPYYAGINEVVMAMNWGLMTDLWGDIPFTEALQVKTIHYPKYDAQQTVLQGINTMLDDAIVKLSAPASGNVYQPGADDIIFNGNIENWIKTAYTLKARYLNRLSNKGNYDPAAIIAALDNGISDASQDCMGIHGGGANESNQWYAFLNNRAYLAASATLVDTMLARTDLRVYYYFDSTGFGTVVGSPIAEPDANVSYWGSYLAGSASTPTPIVTYSEAQFIRAEAEFRRGANSTAATALNTAIVESFKKVTGDIAGSAGIANYTTASTTLGSIMFEKWIAMFGQTEAYSDYRRTKLPVLTPNPNGAINVIPQRYPTPQSERTANPNAPVPSLTDPVWYAIP